MSLFEIPPGLLTLVEWALAFYCARTFWQIVAAILEIKRGGRRP